MAQIYSETAFVGLGKNKPLPESRRVQLTDTLICINRSELVKLLIYLKNVLQMAQAIYHISLNQTQY